MFAEHRLQGVLARQPVPLQTEWVRVYDDRDALVAQAGVPHDSGLVMRRSLPVDYLEIDGGFVKNMENDPIDKAMTETINRIGHITGIETVAEYAETER